MGGSGIEACKISVELGVDGRQAIGQYMIAFVKALRSQLRSPFLAEIVVNGDCILSRILPVYRELYHRTLYEHSIHLNCTFPCPPRRDRNTSP
jgi:hypothetical protein